MEKDLPKNWALPKLKQIVKYQKGKKPKVLNEEEFDGSVPYLDIKAFEKDEVRRYADVASSTLIKKNEIGIVWDGARSGWVSKNKAGAVGSTIAILKPVGVNSDLLYRFLESKFDYLNTNTRGIGIPHVDPNVLWDIDFPLPPLPEQTRIVAKLDQLFGQLEQIKESLDKIPQLLKDFRQQVLTQAVTGKFIGKSGFTTLGKLNISIKTGPFGSALHKSEYIESGIPVINPSHIRNGEITPNNQVSVSDEKAKELERWLLKPNDIILGRRGEMGRCALYTEEDGKMLCGTGSLVLKGNDKVNPTFLDFYLRSAFCINYLESNSVGSTMINLNQKIIKSLPFPNLTIEDQINSIKHLENLFSKADAIEQQYQTLKQKIDTLPQAILHKAFKGELVPQLESDGDARELLEEIKKLTIKDQKPKRKKKIKLSTVESSKNSKSEDGNGSGPQPLKHSNDSKNDVVELKKEPKKEIQFGGGMKLAAIYIPSGVLPYIFGENHVGQTINLGGEYFYKLSELKEKISIDSWSPNPNFIENFWGEDISLISAMVGKNGTGKTSILRAINQEIDNKHIDVLYLYEDGELKLINETKKQIVSNIAFVMPQGFKRNIQKQYYSPNLDFDLRDAFSSISLISYFKDTLDEHYLDSIIRNILLLNNPIVDSLKDVYPDFPTYDNYFISAKRHKKSFFRGLHLESNFGNPNRGDVLVNYLDGDILSMESKDSPSSYSKEQVIDFFKRNKSLLQSESFSALFNKIWDLDEYKCENDRDFVHNSDDFIKNLEVTLLSYVILGAVFPQTSLGGKYDFNLILEAKDFEGRLDRLLELYLANEYEFLYSKIKDTFKSVSSKNKKGILEIIWNDTLSKSAGFEVEPIRKRMTHDVGMFYEIITFYDQVKLLIRDEKLLLQGGNLIFNLKDQSVEIIQKFISQYKKLLESFDNIPAQISILEFRPDRMLSTGEKSLIDLFASLNSYIDRNKNREHQCLENYLLLLDEPELGYHPKWKKKFIQAITKALPILFSELEPHVFDEKSKKTMKSSLKAPRIQIIFTTHDPLTLSDIPNANITYLDKESNGFTRIFDKDLQPKNSFGANISELFADSFFLGDGLLGDFAKEKITDTILWLNCKKLELEIKDLKKGDAEISKKLIKLKTEELLILKEKVKIDNQFYNEKIINMIDEPVLKTKLIEMYSEIFEEDKSNLEDELKYLAEKLGYVITPKSDGK